MRIYLEDEEKEIIESNSRFLKANYGSRRNYSIESALLKKRLIFYNSIASRKKIVHTITDLQSCHNRQLAKISSIVKESSERDQATITTD